MKVLLMGFRSGVAKSLEKMKIPYIIWAEKPIKKSWKAEAAIQDLFPQNASALLEKKRLLKDVTNVIAATESAVIPASMIRKTLSLYRNPENVIDLCTDKLLMKEYLSENHIPMTKFISSDEQTCNTISESLGLPLVAKLKLSSGGRGVHYVENKIDINNFLDNKYYFEKAIKGQEGSIESLIVDGKIIFSNITQYYKNGVCNIIPGLFDAHITKKIEKLNKGVIKSLSVEWGMTHLEYYITENEILFGEVALRPPGGYIMESLKLSYGQDFWDLFVAIELNQKEIKVNQKIGFSSSIIIHPGEGKVSEVIGRQIVEDLESKVEFNLRLKPGDIINKRVGVGQDYGHLLLANESSAALMRDIKSYFKNFKIMIA